jgi:hypothetical protein
MQTEKLVLPIDKYIPEILAATRDYSTVMVKASPGSGKTTRLPWALARGLKKKVVVLEPRRLAAKLAAQELPVTEENLSQAMATELLHWPLKLQTEPAANVGRYDQLRAGQTTTAKEASL